MKNISSSKWFLWVAFYYIIYRILLLYFKTFLSSQWHWESSVLQFQFVNSYLSLFYIGFYLKDMERLKEVRNIWVSARTCFCYSWASVTRLANISHCCSLPSLNPLLFVLICIDFHNHPSICTSVEKMLLVLSLLRSLQRQVRANLLPFLFFKIQMLVVSVPWFFRALLRSKVWTLITSTVWASGQRSISDHFVLKLAWLVPIKTWTQTTSLNSTVWNHMCIDLAFVKRKIQNLK